MTESEILDALAAKLRRLGLATGNGVTTGIGDDAAIFRPRGASHDLAFTTDMMHEGVHFRWDDDPALTGHKALARSLSDAAAMGAKPLFALVSLSFPPQALAWVDGFYQGFTKLAKKHKTILAGGDLAATDKIAIDVMVCAELPRGKALLRSAAKPGETLCVSGPLGKAALALDSRKSFTPQPRLALGQQLLKAGFRCAMDLSDGLSLDLARLCTASGAGAEIDNVPIARGATLQHALHGGEDYELLFTVPKGKQVPKGCTPIGRMTKAHPGQVFYHSQPLPPQGWDHFRLQ